MAVNRLPLLEQDPERQKIAKQNSNAIRIESGWDFGRETGEQQDEFQKDFMKETQYLEIRPLSKKRKKHFYRKHQRSQKKQRNIQAQALFQYNNFFVGQSSQTILQLDELSETAKEGPISSTPYSNLDQNLILNVDLMWVIKDPFSILKGIQRQQIAGEAAQVHHAPRERFPTYGMVTKVAGTKQINIWTAPSTQLQENPTCEPKVLKKKETGHPSEVTSQEQMQLRSQTRTKVKTCSADFQMQIP
ncbi:MAG: hypothetical protein EZS28_022258 [Streblomastix strix]|uniref:Uncharacterized protein n=1 Tax=Streblomastix strix TaxID=222440 RepID=A0A5J4VI63_9EUKA|nr:MAG: hypothetical protein EZS28_022258 [Streblomastix strix]